MAQDITFAGEKLFATQAQLNQALDIDTFIFANVPGQDPTAAIDRNEGLPPVAQRVHTQAVQQKGKINDNIVVYSTVLESITGPFEFNWVGLYSSVHQTLIAVQHIPTVNKTTTVGGAAGNTLNRNFGIEYSGIAALTEITVDAQTWQLDFSARLAGMDILHQQLAKDMNGRDWFIDDGFEVYPRATLNTFGVRAGAAYVSGLRVELENEPVLIADSYPKNVYVDAWFDGDASSTWQTMHEISITSNEINDYVDGNGKQHYVLKIATLNSENDIADLRDEPFLEKRIKDHELKTESAHDSGAINYKNKNVKSALDSGFKIQLQPKIIDKMMAVAKPSFNYMRIENGSLYYGSVFGGDPYQKPKGNYLTAVEWKFSKNPDGLLLLNRGFSGDVSQTEVAQPLVELDGDFIIGGAPNSYATTVGSKFSGSFIGSKIVKFKYFSDNRGGVWRFKVGGPEAGTKEISTFDTNSGIKETIIFENLDPEKKYYYTAEFIGDDPFYIPVDGAGTSRGWLYYMPENNVFQPMICIKFNGISNVKVLSPNGSINDFAIAARSAGAPISSKWVPQHGANSGVSINISTKIFHDEKLIFDGDGQTLITDKTINEAKEVTIQTRFTAINPEENIPLWTHYITEKVESGVLNILNRLEFLVDTQASGYLALIGVSTEDITRGVYSNGREFNISNNPNNDFESNATSGVMYAGAFDSTRGIYHGIGCDVDVLNTCSISTDIEPVEINLQTFRTDNVTKTYWRFSRGQPVKAGTVLRSYARHYMINGVRFPNHEIRSI
ncbi:MAG: phage tail protein [Pseudoalteromonas distincta]|uniref:phage tail-collar fiber domain-containing protein n=1 Tax=Pseudoalteromonas distincta TaxID=77608 RepID=UPI003002F219